MSFSQTYGPQFAGGVFQVASQFIGVSIVESILKQFPNRKVQRGDLYADQARNLLRTNLELIDTADQTGIRALLRLVAAEKGKIESGGGTRLQRILQARNYKCLSKELYVVVKSASDRGINDSLLSQIRRALGETELDSRNPFVDPPEARSLTTSSIDSLDSIEVATYEAETSGERAVSLTMHTEGATTEELLAQIPHDRVDCGGEIPRPFDYWLREVIF
ncbi:hypothetical protein BJV78DRAFT_1288051 [Lactifluus subvellereus]|nr:hypothetical protein BJV78DRAFT_1288051 [Lactifluus subvellereus]